MTAASTLPLAVVLPISSAVLSPLVALVHRRLPLVVGIIAMTVTTVLLAGVTSDVLHGDGRIVTHFLSSERPVRGQSLGIAFAADPFGITFALLTAALGLVLLVSALSELGHLGKRELGGLACLAQLLLAALIGAALTADTINLFVWFEVAALASYGLTGFFLERPIAVEAAFKILVLTSSASFLVFLGAALLYAQRGALNFGQLSGALAGHVGTPELVALALLVAGFGTKAGLMPFHGWLPDAHTPVPGAVSALFSGLMVNLGIVALARLTLQVFPPGSTAVLGLLTVLGAVSAVLGALLALAQDDFKRLLAWDTVSQMGVLVLGFASATHAGVAGATYHLVAHALFKSLLFLCAGGIVHSTGITSISEMGGLARSRPLTATAFVVGALAISGVPPLSGYVSLGLIHEGLRSHPAIYATALLAQVVTVAALARVTWLVFFRPRRRPYEHLEPTRWGMRASLLVLGAGCVLFGVLPGVLVPLFAAPAASVLLHPAVYAAGALGGAGVPPLSVEFAYWSAHGLLVAAVEVAVGLVLAWWYIRRPAEPRPVSALRALHTGSVNDYAAFAAVGLVVSAVALLG